MKRLEHLFKTKEKGIISVFVTAGFPEIDSLQDQLLNLQEQGVDLIEVGIPFSDPLADGPVIQRCSEKALQNGMNPELLFSQIRSVRDQITVPLVLMGYVNPLLQYGIDRFIDNCKRSGIDGLILPDVPVEFYKGNLETPLNEAGIAFSFLVSPQTTTDRIHNLDQLTTGFLYAVSTNAVTGSGSEFGDETVNYFRRLSEMNLDHPVLVGFGIDSEKKVETVNSFLHGSIIGTAYLRAIEEEREFAFLANVMNRDFICSNRE